MVGHLHEQHDSCAFKKPTDSSAWAKIVQIVSEITVKTVAGSHDGTYHWQQNSFPSFQSCLCKLKLQVNVAQAFSFPHPRQLMNFLLSHLKKFARGFPCLWFRMSAGRLGSCALMPSLDTWLEFSYSFSLIQTIVPGNKLIAARNTQPSFCAMTAEEHGLG